MKLWNFFKKDLNAIHKLRTTRAHRARRQHTHQNPVSTKKKLQLFHHEKYIFILARMKNHTTKKDYFEEKIVFF